MIKDLTSKEGQHKIAVMSLAGAVVISAVIFALMDKAVAAGVMFGCILMVLNLRALSRVTGVYQFFDRRIGAGCGKIAACLFYHLRFLLMVGCLYLAVTHMGYDFGIGCFIGFIIPKFSMGVVIISGTGEDWWLKRNAPVETIPGPERNMF